MWNFIHFMRLIIFTGIVMQAACGNPDSTGPDTKITDSVETTEPPQRPVNSAEFFSVDAFSEFPPEIEGCSCYFSRDSTAFAQKEYIYMSNLNDMSIMKLNGAMVKFKKQNERQLDSVNTVTIMKAEGYNMIIKSKTLRPSGDETWIQTGTIQITDSTGHIETRDYYGECGC